MRSRVSRRRIVLRVLLWAVLLAVVAVGYLSYFGFPRPFRSYLCRQADEAGYFLKMKSVTLDLRGGLVFHDLELYRKGVIGAPLFEAERTALDLDLLGKAGVDRLKRARIEGGTVRPGDWNSLLSGSDDSGIVTGMMSVSFSDLTFLGTEISSFSCRVELNTDETRLEDIRAAVSDVDGNGTVTGSIVVAKGDNARVFKGKLVAVARPKAFLPLAEARKLQRLAAVIRRFEFMGPEPLISAGFTVDGTTVTVDGNFSARDFTYREVPVRRGEIPFHVEIAPGSRIVELRPLRLERAEGMLTATLEIDLLAEMVAFRGVSTIDPVAMAALISSTGPDYISDFNFGGPVTVVARGDVDYKDTDICDITAEVRAEMLGYAWFLAEESEFKLQRKGRAITITNVDARAYGGKLSGSLHLYPDAESTNRRYQTTAEATNMDFKKLVALVAPEAAESEGYTGNFSGYMELSGMLGEGNEDTTAGKGSLRISEGNIFNIPLFGDLSGMLVKIVPGLDYVLRQTDAEADFIVEGSVIHTDDLRIEGDILSIKADGDYDWVESELDFDVELRFLKRKTVGGKILTTILWPVSKMFRVRLKGTPDEPEWGSVNF